MTLLRPMSFRAFAKQMGLSPAAIARAAMSGRLSPASVGRDAKGRRVLLDPARAAQELEQHTRPWVNPASRGNGHAAGAPSALAAETLRERRARRRTLEFELGVRRRDFVPARAVEQAWSVLVVEARGALLAIPSRAKSRLPHLTASDCTVLDQLIREALAGLAESHAHKAAASRNGSARRRRARADGPSEAADASRNETE